MTLFSSLTNRLFLAMALLAVVSIGAATYCATAAVTAQAEELRRGLDEAGTLVDEYREELFGTLARGGAGRRPAAVQGHRGAERSPHHEASRRGLPPATRRRPLRGDQRQGLVLADVRTPGGKRVMDVVSVPIGIQFQQPEIFGTLSVGFALHEEPRHGSGCSRTAKLRSAATA